MGTDGFGRSETREKLRNFFEIDRYYITLSALESLSNENLIEKHIVKKCIDKYKLDPEKPNPIKV